MPNEAYVGPPAVAGRGQPPVSASPASYLASAARSAATEYVTNPEFRQNVNSKAGQAVNAVRGRGPKGSKGGKGKGGKGGSRGPTSNESFDFPSGGGVSGLLSIPDPATVKLNTGIAPNCFSDDFMTPVESKCACMHINNVTIDIPSTATDKLYDYIQNVAIPRLQTVAQESVSFNMNVNTDFSAANLNEYFTSLVNAHQIYFYYRSIFTYFYDGSNKNAGMLALKSQVTSSMVERLDDLGRKLAYLPIPPNLLETIRYMSGNYLSGDNQGSPIIKFCPHLASTTMVNSIDLDNVYNLLSTNTISRVGSLLGRAIKNWIPKGFKDVPSVPVYDANFKTIFVNAPSVTYVNTAVNCQPVAATDDTSVQYNSATNNLDGLAYSMFSINRGTAAVPDWSPGLLIPLSSYAASSNCCTRWSYYCISGTYGWYYNNQANFIIASRQDTYTLAGNTNIVAPHLFGMTMCQGVNAGTVRNTAKKVLDYLMSVETIRQNRR